MFLAESMQERSRRIGAVATEQLSVKNQFCVEVYCSVQPRPLAVDLDSGPVNSDPCRRSRRRVGNAVSLSMYPIPNSSMRALNAQFSKNSCCLTKRTSSCVETDGERPDGRPQNALRSDGLHKSRALVNVAVRSLSQVSSKSAS